MRTAARFLATLVMGAAFLLMAVSAAEASAPQGPSTLKRSLGQSDGSTASDRTVTYNDAVGDADAGLAPDITQITVSLVGGRLIFRVGLLKLGAGLINEEFVAVSVNTDRNASTGCDGDEVAMGVLGSTGGNDYARLGRCVGNEFSFDGPQGSLRFSTSPGSGTTGPGAVSFALNAAELGSTNFRFWVGTSYKSTYFDDTKDFTFAASPSTNTSNNPSSSNGIAISRHPDVRAEATGPSGARVRYAPASVRGAKTVTYSKPSGAVFPLGKTTVTITARNGSRVARSSFSVVVADTTSPVFVPFSGFSTNATDPTRATVTYAPVTATDRVSGTVTATCAPVSGSVLAPGATSLSCTARDRAGNSANATYKLAVPIFTTQMSVQTATTYTYDSARRLAGSTTSITVVVPPATDGNAITYTWAATNGTMGGSAPSVQWVRQLDSSGQSVPGTVTVTITYSSGRTEVRTIQFP